MKTVKIQKIYQDKMIGRDEIESIIIRFSGVAAEDRNNFLKKGFDNKSPDELLLEEFENKNARYPQEKENIANNYTLDIRNKQFYGPIKDAQADVTSIIVGELHRARVDLSEVESSSLSIRDVYLASEVIEELIEKDISVRSLVALENDKTFEMVKEALDDRFDTKILWGGNNNGQSYSYKENSTPIKFRSYEESKVALDLAKTLVESGIVNDNGKFLINTLTPPAAPFRIKGVNMFEQEIVDEVREYLMEDPAVQQMAREREKYRIDNNSGELDFNGVDPNQPKEDINPDPQVSMSVSYLVDIFQRESVDIDKSQMDDPEFIDNLQGVLESTLEERMGEIDDNMAAEVLKRIAEKNQGESRVIKP